MGFKDWFKIFSTKDYGRCDTRSYNRHGECMLGIDQAPPYRGPAKPAHGEEYNKMFELYKNFMSLPADNPYRITHELLRRACRARNMRFLYSEKNGNDYVYVFYSPALARPIKFKNIDATKVYINIVDIMWVPFYGPQLAALRAKKLVEGVRRRERQESENISAAIEAAKDARLDAAIRELRELHAHIQSRTTTRTR
ncbi:hypothetical protein HDR66_02245 [bacterium]|nr:hypothetical protein [bacterium]